MVKGIQRKIICIRVHQYLQQIIIIYHLCDTFTLLLSGRRITLISLDLNQPMSILTTNDPNPMNLIHKLISPRIQDSINYPDYYYIEIIPEE